MIGCTVWAWRLQNKCGSRRGAQAGGEEAGAVTQQQALCSISKPLRSKTTTAPTRKKKQRCSLSGIRTRVAGVKVRYPNRLD